MIRLRTTLMFMLLPDPRYRFTDLPVAHPMFRTFFDLPKVPQIPSISHWWRTGGDTSEPGADSAEVHVRGIADGWEREGVDPRYFRQFSVDSYAVGINVLLYTMAH